MAVPSASSESSGLVSSSLHRFYHRFAPLAHACRSRRNHLPRKRRVFSGTAERQTSSTVGGKCNDACLRPSKFLLGALPLLLLQPGASHVRRSLDSCPCSLGLVEPAKFSGCLTGASACDAQRGSCQVRQCSRQRSSATYSRTFSMGQPLQGTGLCKPHAAPLALCSWHDGSIVSVEVLIRCLESRTVSAHADLPRPSRSHIMRSQAFTMLASLELP